jgi:hypothetical protein
VCFSRFSSRADLLRSPSMIEAEAAGFIGPDADPGCGELP